MYNLELNANWGGLVKELGCQIVTSFSHLLHLCDEAIEARQKADKHLCVALRHKVRNRLHPSKEPVCGIGNNK